MNRPRELDINQDFSVNSKIQSGKVTVIVLDGVNGVAYEAEAPEHGKRSLKQRRVTLPESIIELVTRLNSKSGLAVLMANV